MRKENDTNDTLRSVSDIARGIGLSENIFSRNPVSTFDLIVWAEASGMHPILIGSLKESLFQPSKVEAKDQLQNAKECLARAQECFSRGDRFDAEYWELKVYEAIQKVNEKAGNAHEGE